MEKFNRSSATVESEKADLFGPNSFRACGEQAQPQKWLSRVFSCVANTSRPCRELATLLKQPGHGTLKQLSDKVRQFAGNAPCQGGLIGVCSNASGLSVQLVARDEDFDRFKRILGGTRWELQPCLTENKIVTVSLVKASTV